jgi:hypothetical protein
VVSVAGWKKRLCRSYGCVERNMSRQKEQAERAGRKSTRYQCRWVGRGLFQRALVLVARQ